MIQNIKIDMLSPHYNNPRKDLGDLTELAESIKVNGIFQNLTVVPWFSKITGVGADNPKQQEEMGYIVIIGHRRLAAAKLAGLEEVPCVITKMTPQEQMATMLLENMQRNDLTVYEQANGIQMMIDLGETVTSISEKTGFSETTVRRRVKLLDLDDKKFKASVERGATLMDYAELEKIKDIELRNKVLDSIGTPNFKRSLQQAIEKENNIEKKNLLIKELEKFATQINDYKAYQWVKQIYPSSFSENSNIVPEDSDVVEYFFYISPYDCITLYKKEEIIQQDNEEELNAKREKDNRKREILKELTVRAYKLRYDFVKNISYSIVKKMSSIIIEFATKYIIDSYINIDLEEYAGLLNIELTDDEKDDDELIKNVISNRLNHQPEYFFLCLIYLSIDGINDSYFNWRQEYENNENLNMLYELLEELGYKKSDEEIALCNGTHEVFNM